MKKLFEISSEEKNRILEMHETATKRNYLTEQAPPSPTTSVDVKTGTSSAGSKQNLKDVLKLNNKFYFNTGKTGLDKDSIRNFPDVQNFLTKAKEYLTKLNKPFQISWLASESQTPKPNTNVNELSQKRGDSVGNFFWKDLSKLPSYLKDSGVVGRYQQGKIPYKQGVDNPQDPKYLNDQFVEINIWTN
jgi:outer membrane protein OmpA-like peptidoglycan-associated protein